MNIRSFLKDKWLTTMLLVIAIATVEIVLLIYPFGNFIKLYLPIIVFSLYGIGLGAEYMVKRNFYKDLMETLEELEDKYFIAEIIKEPDFTEGKILKRVLEQADKHRSILID